MALLPRLSQGGSDVAVPQPSLGRLLMLGLGGLAASGAVYWALSRYFGWSRPKQVRIASLYVYPIKGCRGHALSKVRLTKWGLEDDRVYMIVNEKKEFVSQRELPRMALIHPDARHASRAAAFQP